MYDGINRIKAVLDYIEENITSDISCDILAQKMNLSVYECRRIFAFIIGCPISEYVRKRRLSLAACEIMTSDRTDVLSLSEKYGYTSQAAFIKAFKEHHGCTPTEYLKQKRDIQLFTVPKLEVRITNRETVPFQIINEPAFCISGYTGISTITDTCCCEDVWNAFYESGTDKTLSADTLYVSYHNRGDNVACCIGQKSKEGLEIPASRWACFTMQTTDDSIVNETYGKIIYEWLPSANVSLNRELPTVEVYPYDMEEEGFLWEIRIPIK